MDIVSHGLWGGAAFGRKNKKSFWLAFAFGIAPDLFSFGILFAHRLLIRWGVISGEILSAFDRPDLPAPTYVYTLYNFTHSLIIFAAVFFLLWLIFRRPIWELGAWGIHIGLDIFTHSYRFFPTPFLWPVSDFKFDGRSWGSPEIFFPNAALLLIAYSWFFIFRKRKNNRERLENKKFG